MREVVDATPFVVTLGTFLLTVTAYGVGRCQQSLETGRFRRHIHLFLDMLGWKASVCDEGLYYAPGTEYPAKALTILEALCYEAGKIRLQRKMGGVE